MSINAMWKKKKKKKKKRERSESEKQRENCIDISHCSRVKTEALSLLMKVTVYETMKYKHLVRGVA